MSAGDRSGAASPGGRSSQGSAADSGLQLLMMRSAPAVLRWAPDRHAPGMRELADGEVRLLILRFSLAMRPGDRRPRPSGGSPGPASTDWLPVTAVGIVTVTESRAPGVGIGQVLRGPAHAGTHLVVTASTLDLPLYERCGHHASVPCPGEDVGWASGPEAVEQALAVNHGRHDACRPPRWLSLSMPTSSHRPSLPISVASCCHRLLRHPTSDSSTARPSI